MFVGGSLPAASGERATLELGEWGVGSVSGRVPLGNLARTYVWGALKRRIRRAGVSSSSPTVLMGWGVEARASRIAAAVVIVLGECVGLIQVCERDRKEDSGVFEAPSWCSMGDGECQRVK